MRTDMRAICAGFLGFVTLAALTPGAPHGQHAPTWARKGVDFRAACGDNDRKQCRPLRIPSPDGWSSVEVSYETDSKYPGLEFAALRVISEGRNLGQVLPVGTVENEIVWSPDSAAFFINGNSNGNGDYHVAVHQLNDSNLGPGRITKEVEEDMVRSFPPCRSKDLSVKDCTALLRDPGGYIGTAGLDWIGGSSEMVVMAEVTCSSSMGGIMCQVLGYEISVPSGKIMRRMEAKAFARRWQRSMEWKFHIPDPPEFSDK